MIGGFNDGHVDVKSDVGVNNVNQSAKQRGNIFQIEHGTSGGSDRRPAVAK